MSTLRVDNLRGQTADGTNKYVVQVVSETINTQSNISVTGGTYSDTGITATITPKFSTSKILVSFVIGGTGANSTGDTIFRLVRGSTDIAQGASGTYIGTIATRNLNAELTCTPCFTHLDNPSTTSATTYKVQGTIPSNSTLAINRRQADNAFGTASNITLMEIAQ